VEISWNNYSQMCALTEYQVDYSDVKDQDIYIKGQVVFCIIHVFFYQNSTLTESHLRLHWCIFQCRGEQDCKNKMYT